MSGPQSVGSVQAQLSSKGNRETGGWLWLVLQGCQQVVTGRRGTPSVRGSLEKVAEECMSYSTGTWVSISTHRKDDGQS